MRCCRCTSGGRSACRSRSARRDLVGFALTLVAILYLSFVALVGYGALAHSTSFSANAPSMGRGEYTLRSMLTPFSTQSPGTVTVRTAVAYRGNQPVWGNRAIGLNPPFIFTREWNKGFRAAIPAIAGIAACAVGVPLVFVVLPVTMRQAKVRWAHIVRIFTYSLVFVAIAVLLRETVMLEGMDPTKWVRPPAPSPTVKWLLMIMIGLWWLAAIKRYLRLRHAVGVALALVAIGVLVGIAVETWLLLEMDLI